MKISKKLRTQRLFQYFHLPAKIDFKGGEIQFVIFFSLFFNLKKNG